MSQIRFVENEFPEQGEIVFCKITSCNDLGSEAILLEYGNLNGFLPISEYSRKRIKSIRALIKPGNREVLEVMDVDPIKGYVDLSRKHVTDDERKDCADLFKQRKQVVSFGKTLGRKLKLDPLTVLQSAFWNHDESVLNSEFFTKLTLNPDKLERFIEEMDFSEIDKESFAKEFTKILRQKYTPKKQKVWASIGIRCFGCGINGIRKIINANNDSGLQIVLSKEHSSNANDKQDPSKYKPMNFKIFTETKNKQEAVKRIKETLLSMSKVADEINNTQLKDEKELFKCKIFVFGSSDPLN